MISVESTSGQVLYQRLPALPVHHHRVQGKLSQDASSRVVGCLASLAGLQIIVMLHSSVWADLVITNSVADVQSKLPAAGVAGRGARHARGPERRGGGRAG